MDSSTNGIGNSFNLFEQEIRLEDPLDAGGRVYKCKFPFNKRPLAVKRIEMDDATLLKDWQSLIDLRNENVVTYHCSYVRDSFRYLVMDLCWASMMDFCLGRLIHVSDVEIGRIMAETARGLDFLHRSNIIHGRLGLDHVLLWRKRPDLKPIAKLSGYFPSSPQQFRIQDDLEALGCTFYSMAAKDINPPRKLPVSSTELSLISFNQRESASEMINLLLVASPAESHLKPTTVKALLHGQSFFKTHCSTTAQDRMRDVKELEDFDDITKGYFDEDDVQGLKEILIESSSAAEDVDEFMTKAIEKYPKLFAEFLWDLLNYPPLEKLTFVERPSSSHLGSGSAGMILAGKWIQPNQKELAVACKRFYIENNGMAKFHKEYEALRQLDHFFVIKCIKACQIEGDPYLNHFTSSCIIMDLCEGTLKNYVLGELATIPKNSLDEKNILGQVTLGLAYIHSKEMIHKDLKPANILIWRSPCQSSLVVAKLADFDFAKQLATARGEFSGTYRPGTKDYMAPEILTALEEQNTNGRHEKRKVFATVASDAYSLGITMAFTLLKGKHPFGNSLLLRADIMKSGADPFLLGDLEWDAIDLILRLTRKDPQERPKISFLIYHPYFVLANEKSQAHFAEKLDDYFNQFPSPYKARMAYINQSKIQEWMSVVKSQTEREANLEMKKWLEQKTKSLMKETQDHLDKSKEYYEKIKMEIQSDNDNDVNQTFHNEASKPQSFTDYFRDWPLWTRRLIKSAPRFSVSYFWCLINDRVTVEDDPRSQHSSTFLKRYYSNEQNQLKPPDIDRTINIFKIDEHVHACLYLKCQEEKEQVWNLKRAGRISDALTDGGIHRLLRELPSYAAPSSIIKNLINRMDNINSCDENKTTVLHWMLRNRWQEIDVSIITHLLERKANPKMGDKDGTTAVHYAAKNETSQGPAILRCLLEKGDPNQLNGSERKRTALHYAAMNESSYAPDIVKILLEFGGQVQVNDKHGFTPLHYAARNKSKESPDIVKILLDRGGNPNKTLLQLLMVPPFNRTPVHIATMNESESGLKMLKILLARGGNPNVYDSNRETPLHYAAKSQSNFGPKMIETLVENQGNLALPTHLSKFPIHFAAENVSPSGPSIMKMILEHGGDPCVHFRNVGTAVHIAAGNQSESGLAILQLLLDNNGNPNSSTGYTSPVHCAATNKSSNGLNLLKLLLEKGGDPNALDAHGRTPVHLAAENESDVAPELLTLLLEKGGKVEVFDKMKMTPIHVAAENQSNSGPIVLKILLESGADPNAVDDNQETPVHYATKNQSSHAPSILQFLLNNGGNCNVFNQRNKTPFDLAVENTSDSAPKLLEILLGKGFDPNVVNPSGTTSVHLAAANESNSGPRILALLLENGGDCNVADGDNKTPIHYAAKNESKGATEMMKILMDKGANPNAVSSTGLSPVHLASSNKSCSGLDILKILHERGANLDVADDFGTRPIHLAAQTQTKTDIIEFLLDNGDGRCYVNEFDFCRENVTKYNMHDQNWRYEEFKLLPDGKRKRTPVHYAAENETFLHRSSFKPNVIKLLVERGGDPNFEDERKRTPVHLAVRNGGFNGSSILKILLKNKGNPNAVDDQMRTPVHMAALSVYMSNTKVDMMKLLLEYKGDPNAVDSFGRTPLHYAAINPSANAPKMMEMMELLLKHGGDGDVRDREGKTAIDLTADGQSIEMQKLLKTHYKNNKL